MADKKIIATFISENGDKYEAYEKEKDTIQKIATLGPPKSYGIMKNGIFIDGAEDSSDAIEKAKIRSGR